MKLTLPIFTGMINDNKVLASVMLIGKWRNLIIDCHNKETARSIYSEFLFIRFDTNDLYYNEFADVSRDCIDYDDISYTKVTEEEMGEFQKQSNRIFERYAL